MTNGTEMNSRKKSHNNFNLQWLILLGEIKIKFIVFIANIRNLNNKNRKGKSCIDFLSPKNVLICTVLTEQCNKKCT